ncbi:MAG: hypothetical protein U0930_13890 [Pirellulales bacterium]
MSNAPSDSPFEFEIAQSSECMDAESAPQSSQSHDSQTNWWQHALGLFLIIVSTIVAAMIYLTSSREAPILLCIGVASGYYTLICCWWVFGNQTYRFKLGLIMFGLLYFIQIAIAMTEPGPGIPVILSLIFGFLLANAGFVLVKLLSVILLKWLSRVEIRLKHQLDKSVSNRIRYGLAEIMLVTTIVAVLVAVMRSIDGRSEIGGGFGRIVLVLACINIFHFLIFWPLLFAGFVVRMRVILTALSIGVFALTVWSQEPFFNAVLGNGGGYAEILMLDSTFAITVALHFAIANLSGYQLVQRQKA